METTTVRCLVNSISRFIHLVSCQTTKTMPFQKDYTCIVGVLKLLKPVVDDIVDSQIPSDVLLYKECEALDGIVNEAREFMENWSPKMSKICSVLKCEPLLRRIYLSSLDICGIICRLMQSAPSGSAPTAVQHCMQTIKSFKQVTISEHIEEALRSQRDHICPCTETLSKITVSLSFTSSQELLKETIAVEKERIDVEVNEAQGDLYLMNQIVDLLANIRDWLARSGRLEGVGEVSIPPYFRCPLSLELMLDPVIVASGQTYDRSSIQKWLDHGLNICPRTRQVLSHSNLIPNYTVKAMIANWCEENKISLSNYSEPKSVSITSPSACVSREDLNRTDSFHCSLPSGNFTSRSSPKVGNGIEKQNADLSARPCAEKSNRFQSMGTEKSYNASPEHSCVYSRSESARSGVSSTDSVTSALNEALRTSSIQDCINDLSGEISCEYPAASPSEQWVFSPSFAGRQSQSRKVEVGLAENGNSGSARGHSLPQSESRSDKLTTTSDVQKLIEDLKSHRNEVRTKATEELRYLAKHNMENRIIIGRCGAITPLLSLLYSEVQLTQEHAVTALLNLSIDDNNKAMIADAGAIEPLIHVLNTGSDVAKENSAATLFSLSVLEEYKAKIGRSGAIKALVNLLGSGTLRGKKDAATALFNLSIFHENKARIIQAGAVKYLVEFLDPATGMVDKAAAILANLSTIGEGRLAIVREGAIPLLVEMADSGSMRGKENAASIFLQLCLHSSKFCTLILQEGAVPPLVALSQSGTPRAKEKAQQLLSHFRNQREGGAGKRKS